MSKNTSSGSDGSDGSWFLEAVGAKEKTPSPSEAVAHLTAENAIVDLRKPSDASTSGSDESPAAAHEADPVSYSTFDGDPGTSTSSFHPVPDAPPPPDLSAVPAKEDVPGTSPTGS